MLTITIPYVTNDQERKVEYFNDIYYFNLDFSMLIVVVVPGIILLRYLQTKYNYEYNIQKYAIIAFLFTEAACLVIYTLPTIKGLLSGSTLKFIVKMGNFINATGLRSTIQAIGFIFIKLTRDPLQGI
jgi:hypothetical protein